MNDPLLIFISVVFYLLVVAPAFARWVSTGEPEYPDCIKAGIILTIGYGIIGGIVFYLIIRLLGTP